MNEIMEVVQISKKSRILGTLEKFYIYRETKRSNQINDKLTIQFNPIFEVLVQTHNPQRAAAPHIESESYEITLTQNLVKNQGQY
jgi:hypothetical protein